ncbi:ABC transporter permease [Micromonospora craniellae]|uniref:ABC transporter permease n=1 Tax=Micromonospora craniellae TaxID=2294034 RepID=A0A372FU27_9ACTN|nr:ABC transporter permease [Micromonospora craniellae]RFS44302.1 ABC transporter permease [Micromonospora craniellae]
MLRLTLRSLRAEAARMVMSTLAVVLGVAFIAGTLIFIDGMRAGAYDRAGTFDRHTDAGIYAAREPIDPALVDRVRAVDGVRAAEGELTGAAGVVGGDGRPVLGFGVLAAVPTDPALRSYDVVAGRLPARPGEVVLDQRTVDAQSFRLGSTVRVGGAAGAAEPYTLVGVDVADTPHDIGGPFIGLVGVDALAVTGSSGYGRIMVVAEPGIADTELAARLADIAGADTTVRTRAEILDAAVAAAVRDVDQFHMALLTFAAVAVVVAAFVIGNTFTIVLAQRTRRTALLRLVGATRGQVFQAAVLESAVVGLAASTLGVLAGAGLAAALTALAGAASAGQIVLVALGGVLSIFGVVLFGPRRVAATATALVIGIGLVSSFLVGAQSTKAAIERTVDAEVGVDFLVTGIGVELPAGLTDALATRPELGVVHEARTRSVDDVEYRAIHPALVGDQVEQVISGSVDRIGPGRILVDRELAQRRGWSAGDQVTLRSRTFEVAAVVVGLGSGGTGSTVPPGHAVGLVDADHTRLLPDERGVLAEVEPAPGVPAGSARAAIEAVLADYPTINLMDQAAYERMLTSTVDMLLAFVVALLGLAVVIALVGVANTLSLSVVERTRENAVLRAVGLTGGRMRAMLAVEAVLTALVGAVLGVTLGTGVTAGAMALLARLAGEFTLVVPWARLAGVLAVAMLAALLASVLPARRALSRPVVEALADQ